MPEDVKPTRRYESPRRREQASATRQAVLEAAQVLFERDGYAATTIAAIAAEAGVSPKTVYLAFATKSGVLRALWHLLLRGDQAEVPVPERLWYVGVLAEPDPQRQLLLLAEGSRTVKVRAGRLMRVIRDAAPADPDSGELWERIQSEFHGVLLRVAESLDAKGALRPGLTPVRAADELWIVHHPDVWNLLERERGWTAAEFESWAAETTCERLLAGRPAPGSG